MIRKYLAYFQVSEYNVLLSVKKKNIHFSNLDVFLSREKLSFYRKKNENVQQLVCRENCCNVTLLLTLWCFFFLHNIINVGYRYYVK